MPHPSTEYSQFSIVANLHVDQLQYIKKKKKKKKKAIVQCSLICTKICFQVYLVQLQLHLSYSYVLQPLPCTAKIASTTQLFFVHNFFGSIGRLLIGDYKRQSISALQPKGLVYETTIPNILQLLAVSAHFTVHLLQKSMPCFHTTVMDIGLQHLMIFPEGG